MRGLTRVAIVDDNQNSRETFRDDLESHKFLPEPLEGPFATVDALVEAVRSRADVAICDHHLIANYAGFDGAEAVASLYRQQLPAVLVTAWSKADIHEIQPFRRRIPILLTPEDAGLERIAHGWDVCREEFCGRFSPSRRPWQTLVQIEDVVDDDVFVVLPGWKSDEVIRLRKDMIGEALHQHLRPGERFFAMVNKGAEQQSDLFFEDFKYRP
jgi:CheY-like chemotaxis protein